MNNNFVKDAIIFIVVLVGIALIGIVTMNTIITENVNNGLDIQRFHDDEKNVTCWYSDSGRLSVPPSISCIPDSQLEEIYGPTEQQK